jgi:uncharacterized membrane protein YccC
MTVLVLMCFNQMGDGGMLIVPRLVDTAIGSVIAGLAMVLVLPHWQARRFNELAAAAMRNQGLYLRGIAGQYRAGAGDDLAYRLARRNAHNADAALASAVSEMFREPALVRPRAGVALRFLIQSHTLLSYLSALGAHRVALPEPGHAAALHAVAAGAAQALEELAAGIEAGSAQALEAMGARVPEVQALSRSGPDGAGDPATQLVRTELSLIGQQVETLRGHALRWLQPEAA